MRIYTKLLALLIAALTFGLAASTASAGRLSIDDTDFEIIWPEAEDLDFNAAGSIAACSVTLLGSFHSRTIRKTANALIGAVSHAVIGDCDGGTAAIDAANDPPWHVRYVSFSGTLPAITGFIIELSGQRFIIVDFDNGANCLSNAGASARGRANVAANGQIGSLTALSAPTIPVDDIGGSFLCDLAGSGSFSGVSIVTDLDQELLFVTLI